MTDYVPSALHSQRLFDFARVYVSKCLRLRLQPLLPSRIHNAIAAIAVDGAAPVNIDAAGDDITGVDIGPSGSPVADIRVTPSTREAAPTHRGVAVSAKAGRRFQLQSRRHAS